MNMATTLMAAKATQAANSRRSVRHKPAAPDSLRSARDEAVAHIAYRLDEFLLEFRAQPPHTDVDDVAARVERVPPDLGEQLVAGAPLAGVTHQVAEQDDLPLRERNPPTAEAQLTALQIEPPPAGVEPPRRGR